MVEQHLFAIYSQAGKTILEGRCTENANTSIVPTIPDIAPQVVPNKDPQQRNHRDSAEMRRNIGRDASRRVQRPAFSLLN